jgi:hypothetical protein
MMAHGAYLLLKFSAFSLTEFAIFLWALWALLICDPLFMGETSAGGASTGGVFDGTPPPARVFWRLHSAAISGLTGSIDDNPSVIPSALVEPSAFSSSKRT